MDAFLNRRRFLRHSAAFGGSIFVCSIALDRSTNATPVRIEPPAVDEVTVREITDGSHDIFMHGEKRPGLIVTRTGTPEAAQGKTLESEWGLALHIESHKGSETRRYLLDFGFTPDVYANNLEILKIDVAQVDALIISHGHYDHIGGLMGFLETQRAKDAQRFAPVRRRERRFLPSLSPQHGWQLCRIRHRVGSTWAASPERRIDNFWSAHRH